MLCLFEFHNYRLLGDKIVEETWGSNRIEYIYDENGAPLSMYYNGVKYYFVLNLQGDVVKLLDSTNAVVANYSYDAWGNMLSIADADGTSLAGQSTHIANINPLRYRSYYYDNDTGLYYLQSRYYDPAVGRFINADGQFNEGFLGINLFAYCENNPVNYSDPSGSFVELLLGAAAVLLSPEVLLIVGVGALGTAGGMVIAVVVDAWKYKHRPSEDYSGGNTGGSYDPTSDDDSYPDSSGYYEQNYSSLATSYNNYSYSTSAPVYNNSDLGLEGIRETVLYANSKRKPGRPELKKQGREVNEKKRNTENGKEWKVNPNKRPRSQPRSHSPGEDHRKAQYWDKK